MKAFDCNCKLSYELALKFKTDGYAAALRYVGRLKKATIDIDKVETNNILSAGLGLGIVQHCPPKPGIIPSKELGIEYGKNAVIFAREAGYKEQCINYLDLEDVNPDYSKKQTLIYDYCNYWYDMVYKTYLPGIYVGFNTYLSGDDLFYKLKYKDYWKAFSKVPDVTRRGYAMLQGSQITVNGIQIDPNEITGDRLGGSPVFMYADRNLVKTINVYSNGDVEVKEVK